MGIKLNEGKKTATQKGYINPNDNVLMINKHLIEF
jgi:hypothetical protein